MNGGSIFVLLVDNDAEFAAAAARSFESVGMRALVALDSSPYAHSLADNSIDVFVTDIKRESHGHKLVWMLKKWKPGVPIIVMTAHPELVPDRTSLSAAPAQPLEIAKLCRAIRVHQVH
jgi:DNA-binding NtrC family response regulator